MRVRGPQAVFSGYLKILVFTAIVREVVYSGSEIGGKEALAEPNREIGFGFVSCSCRACERAGEAKLRGRVRAMSPHRWASKLKFVRLLAGGS